MLVGFVTVAVETVDRARMTRHPAPAVSISRPLLQCIKLSLCSMRVYTFHQTVEARDHTGSVQVLQLSV